MQAYRYKAISRDGIEVKGVIEAYDDYEAIQKIKVDCPIITEVEEIKATKMNGLMNLEIGGKIKAKDLAIMCSQFSIVLKAGMPLGRAVEMIARQTQNDRLKKILVAVSADVQGGRGLAQSLLDEGGEELPATLIETIRAGEESGNLDISFDRSQHYYENHNKLRTKVVGAMIQPVFTLVVAVVVVAILMIFVVPGFTASFKELGTELPAMTKALIAISEFLGRWWMLILAIILLAVILIRAYASTPKGKIATAKRMMNMPVIGKMITMTAASEFATTMSTMLGSGLTILQAIRVTGKAMSNEFAGKATADMEQSIMMGRSLGSSIKNLEFYPEILREMTGIGEDTGTLEDTMKTMGEYYSSEAEYATTKFVGTLEPLLLCCVAVIAGFIVIAMYMAMFSMYGAM